MYALLAKNMLQMTIGIKNNKVYFFSRKVANAQPMVASFVEELPKMMFFKPERQN